jgi:hypothetical protein
MGSAATEAGCRNNGVNLLAAAPTIIERRKGYLSDGA